MAYLLFYQASTFAWQSGISDWGIFWGSIFFAIVFAVPVLAVGLLWAPFAALICWRVANSKGLKGRRYAVAGAAYSILYFFPWVYLVARLYDRTFPRILVRGVYVILYCVIWPLAALSVFFPAQGPPPLNLFLLMLLPIAATWFLSLRRLIGWRNLDRSASDDLSDDVMPNTVYILPFAFAYIWTLVTAAAWGLFYWITSDTSELVNRLSVFWNNKDMGFWTLIS